MHRVLFELGGLSITSWGAMVAIAFVVGTWLAERRAIKYEIPKSIISDLSLVLIIAGIVGGRISYVVENLDYYTKSPGQIFKVWEGGLIFYGGFAAAVLFGIIFLKKKHVNVLKVIDVVAPSVALGLGIARIGCFLNGCCFGKPTHLPWGVMFPSDSPCGWAFEGVTRVHPTQIYETLAAVCMFLILLLAEKKHRPYGYLFGLFLALYGGWRFFVDFLRYYDPKAYVLFGLTHNQLISILMFLGAVAVILIRKRASYLRHT